MIFRHEIIGLKNKELPEEKEKNKTMERFKNRPDKLTYRSVVYDPETPETSDLKLMERNYGREVKIKKMTQKFEIDDDPRKPPSS